LIKTEKEVEGRYEDVWLVVEEDPLEQWPAGARTIVGRDAERVDAPQRVRGEARYTADLQFPGMLHTAVLRNPHAYARVERIDFERARNVPGVRAVLGPGEAKGLEQEAGYHGAPVAAIAADTFAQAQAAILLLDVEWDVRDPALDPEQSERHDEPNTFERGDLEAGLAEADVVVEAEYRTQSVLHNSFETHQAICRWEGDVLEVYISTQFIWGIRDSVASELALPPDKVRVVCEYMGGGFGAKNDPGEYTFIAAELAKRTGRPVRCALTRREENLAAGNRNSTVQRRRALGRHAYSARRGVRQLDRLVGLDSADGRADANALRLPERPHGRAQREGEHAADEGIPRARFRRRDVRPRVPARRARGEARRRSARAAEEELRARLERPPLLVEEPDGVLSPRRGPLGPPAGGARA
jgi:hypothetical protein